MTPPPMNTPVRVGETIEGSRTMRNRPYPVLKCSSEANDIFDTLDDHLGYGSDPGSGW